MDSVGVRSLKVILLGGPKVGKTSIINSFASALRYSPNTYSKTIHVDEQLFQVLIWDEVLCCRLSIISNALKSPYFLLCNSNGSG